MTTPNNQLNNRSLVIGPGAIPAPLASSSSQSNIHSKPPHANTTLSKLPIQLSDKDKFVTRKSSTALDNDEIQLDQQVLKLKQ